MASSEEKKLVHRIHSEEILQKIPRDWPLLIVATGGILRLASSTRSYILSRYLVLRIPGGRADVKFWPDEGNYTVFAFESMNALGAKESVVRISTLTRELLSATAPMSGLRASVPHELNIYNLLLHSLSTTEPVEVSVPLPTDSRALRLFHNLTENDGMTLGLEALAQKSGASNRTIERIIRREVGMSFSQWRQLIRVQQSIGLLEKGMSIHQIASEVGYGSASAYINAFKRHIGVSPHQFRVSHLNQNES